MHFGCGLYIGVEFYLAPGGRGGGGGWVHIQIPVSWVGGGKHCKLHAFVLYILKVHDYIHLYDKHSFHAWNFMRINIDRCASLYCGYVALWKEKTFMRTGTFLMNSSRNWFESYFFTISEWQEVTAM